MCTQMCVPFSLQSIAEMRVVFGRINRMMAMKESGSSTLLHQDKKSGLQRPVSEASIKFDQATLAWAADSDPILIDATFELAQGELIMVVGPVGRYCVTHGTILPCTVCSRLFCTAARVAW